MHHTRSCPGSDAQLAEQDICPGVSGVAAVGGGGGGGVILGEQYIYICVLYVAMEHKVYRMVVSSNIEHSCNKHVQ